MNDPGLGRPTTGLSRSHGGAGGGAIRIGTTHGGELASVVNHAFFVCQDRVTAIEQTAPRVRESNIADTFDNDEHWFILVEHVGISELKHRRMEKEARSHLGETYGWVAIAKKSLDGMLGWLFRRSFFAFRRIRLPWVDASVLYLVCSVFDCLIHKSAGLFYFAMVTRYKPSRHPRPRITKVRRLEVLEPHLATPDDLWDDIFHWRPFAFIVRAEGGRRPDDLPWIYAKRIEDDLARPRKPLDSPPDPAPE